MKRTDSEYIKFILSETYVENSEFYTLPPDSKWSVYDWGRNSLCDHVSIFFIGLLQSRSHPTLPFIFVICGLQREKLKSKIWIRWRIIIFHLNQDLNRVYVWEKFERKSRQKWQCVMYLVCQNFLFVVFLYCMINILVFILNFCWIFLKRTK